MCRGRVLLLLPSKPDAMWLWLDQARCSYLTVLKQRCQGCQRLYISCALMDRPLFCFMVLDESKAVLMLQDVICCAPPKILLFPS